MFSTVTPSSQHRTSRRRDAVRHCWRSSPPAPPALLRHLLLCDFALIQPAIGTNGDHHREHPAVPAAPQSADGEPDHLPHPRAPAVRHAPNQSVPTLAGAAAAVLALASSSPVGTW